MSFPASTLLSPVIDHKAPTESPASGPHSVSPAPSLPYSVFYVALSSSLSLKITSSSLTFPLSSFMAKTDSPLVHAYAYIATYTIINLDSVNERKQYLSS